MTTPLLDGIRKMSAKDAFKEKYGITHTEKAQSSHSFHSIGYSPSRKKWYGWSHRAINGFGIGSKVKMGDCGFLPSNKEEFLEDLKRFWGKDGKYTVTPEGVKRQGVGKIPLESFEPYPDKWGRGEWTARTMDDAKQMAKDFSNGVS